MEIKARSKKLADLRAFLEVERERLLEEIQHGEVTTDEERAGYSNHMADDASVVFEQARNVGMRRSHELLLADVEEALQRMDAGTYGVCRHCGAPIDAARLRVMPTAAFCLVCQQHREQSQH
jgi:RNA polymerase-binding protein DksA